MQGDKMLPLFASLRLARFPVHDRRGASMTRQTITKKQLQNVPIDALKPYKTNPRRNDGKPVEGVAQSLTEFTT